MSANRTICIQGGAVWPGGDHPLVDGGVLIRGTRIEAVLTPDEAASATAYADEVVDARGLLLMPPFVNCHVHSTSTLLRGTQNSLPLELWSYYAINYGREFTEEAVRYAVLLTDIEMIRNGIGSYIDHFPQSHRASAALDGHIQSGLRIGFAPFFADMWDEDILNIPLDRKVLEEIAPLAPRKPEDVRSNFVRLSQDIRSSGRGRISLLAGPNSPQRCSDGLWRLWQELQEKLNIGSHTHLLETFPQSRAARIRWPGGMIDALAEAGLLHDRLSVGHGIWLDAKEKELLAKHGVTISYNPVSNGMLGSGGKRIREDLDVGLKIALGTDCSNTGGRHDLFEVMRHMLISGRDPGSNFERWLTPKDVLIAATAAGARAICGPKTAGTLKADGVADILVIDLEAAGMAAASKSLNSVATQADPRNVHSLMIDGQWLLRGGVITVLEEAAVLEKARHHAEGLRAAAAERIAAIEGLHESYAGWQRSVFSGHACPACGNVRSPGAAPYQCN